MRSTGAGESACWLAACASSAQQQAEANRAKWLVVPGCCLGVVRGTTTALVLLVVPHPHQEEEEQGEEARNKQPAGRQITVVYSIRTVFLDDQRIFELLLLKEEAEGGS